MPDVSEKNIRIGLLGASFDTGNLGVSALAESSILCILHQWPDAEIDLLASGRSEKKYQLSIAGRNLEVTNVPVRFCKNIFMKNHYVVLFLSALFLKIFRFEKARRFLAGHNRYIEHILDLKLVADITGGDSFSDIYGTRRFVMAALTKYLWLMFGKKLVFLPQTYGPFERKWVRWCARFLLKRSSYIFSRDQQGYIRVHELLGKKDETLDHVKVVPDVAFALEPAEVDDSLTKHIESFKQEGKVIIGLNISGLLYNGGYTQKNMFSLSSNYPDLIKEIICAFLQHEDVIILLVPHVCPSQGYQLESDPVACKKILSQLGDPLNERVLFASSGYDHKHIKYIIGLSDFFMGSRMHSCIAALSQCIPTVGLAYSDKFTGVFGVIGQSDNVIDLRGTKQEKILRLLEEKYQQKDQNREHLESTIPSIKREVVSILSLY